MVAVAVVILALASCGDDGASAEDKCNALADDACTRLSACSGGSKAECLAGFMNSLDCGAAKDVSSTYDTCIGQLDTASCESLVVDGQVTLPASCDGVILF